jgi:hypothetical protein
LGNVLGVNVRLYNIRLLTPCCRNNLSQAPFSSCHFYSRTLGEECPGVYHIKSKIFSLASPVVLRQLIFASVAPANSPCSVLSNRLSHFPLHNFLLQVTGFRRLLFILQPWVDVSFPKLHLSTFHSMPFDFFKTSFEIGFLHYTYSYFTNLDFISPFSNSYFVLF